MIALLIASVEGCVIVASEVDSLESVLPELNIVALKQSDRLRSLPVGSSLLSREDLEIVGASAVRSLAEMVPNLYIPDYGSRVTSSIYMRGIGARMDNPSVGLTVDNVAILNKDAYDFDIPDIANVEVLRGPRSVLYGRNTMAGLINVSTISPYRFSGFRESLTIGNGGLIKGDAGFYKMLSSVSALSVAVAASHQNGFFTNAFTGKKCDSENGGSLRAKYLRRFDNSLSLQNVAFVSLLHQRGYPYESVELGDINYNDECHYKRFFVSDGFTLNKYHEKFSATSVTSLQFLDNDLLLDQDFLPLPYFTLNQLKKELALSEDLTLRSVASDSPYTWLAGVSGFFKNLNMNAPVLFKNNGIASLIEYHRNDANPYHPIAWQDRKFSLNSDFHNATWGIAAYHESSLRLGEFTIKAALRVDFESSRLNYHSYCSTGYGIYSNPDRLPVETFSDVESLPLEREVKVNLNENGKLKRCFFIPLPSFSIIKGFCDDQMNLYASFSRGAKSGGFNTQMFSDVLQQRLMHFMGIGMAYDVDEIVAYKPEKSWNYEVGTHLSFPSIHLQTDGSLFFIDCRDQQLTMFPDGTTTGRIMTNAGRTHSIGFEISGTWQPGDNLTFNFSYGFTDARFRKFFDGKMNYRGNRLPYVPRNTFFSQAVYRHNLGKRGSLIADVNLRLTGDIEWNESNTLRQPLYALLGGSIAWEGDNWSVRLWGRNLTDTRYYNFYFISMKNEFVQRGKPLETGITFSLVMPQK